MCIWGQAAHPKGKKTNKEQPEESQGKKVYLESVVNVAARSSKIRLTKHPLDLALIVHCYNEAVSVGAGCVSLLDCEIFSRNKVPCLISA